MSKFYFFTDIDLLNSQTVNDEFGPDSSDPDNKFRITSAHSSSGSPNAYAICSGNVMIQEDVTNSSLVNLILNPSEQPDVNLPRIKYIVYRGIEKSSLIDLSDNTILQNTIDLTISIYASQERENISNDTPGLKPPASALEATFDVIPNGVGTASSATTTTLVDTAQSFTIDALIGDYIRITAGTGIGQVRLITDNNVTSVTVAAWAVVPDNTSTYSILDKNTPVLRSFFKADNESQPPEVEAGSSLGKFKAAEFGIEIIVDQIGFEPDLEYAAKHEHILEVTALPGGPTQKQRFIHFKEKEQILNFIDPCPFYGSFFDNRIIVKRSNNSEEKKKKDNIYKDVLRGPSGNSSNVFFLNRNKVYIDIRDELNYPWTYYLNYVANTPLKVAFDQGTQLNSFSQLDYYRNGWPILIFDTSDFPTGNTDNENLIRFSFPIVDNPNPILFVSQGKIKRKFLERFKGKKSFKFLDFPLGGDFSEDIALLTPNLTDNSVTEPLSTYIRLRYLNPNPQCPADIVPPDPPTLIPPDTEFRGLYDLENIFTPFDMVIPWQASPGTSLQSNVYSEEVYVDVLRTSGQSFMADVGIAKDTNGNVTLFAFATDKIVNNLRTKNTPFSLVGSSRLVGDQRFLQRIASDFNLVFQNIRLNFGNPSTDPFVEFFGNVDPTAVGKFQDLNLDDFAFMTFSSADFIILQNLFTGAGFLTGPGFKTHLGLKFIENNTDQNSVDYVKYEVVLRGYAEVQGNANQLEVSDLDTGVFHYRLRRDITRDVLEGEDPIVSAPRARGSGFSIQNLGRDTFEEPNGQQAQDPDGATSISKKKINCDIYLIRGHTLNVTEFCEYMDYFRDNIQQVWNTSSNIGLVSTFDALDTGIYTRTHIIDASGVKVHEATAKHFNRIENNEVLLLVEKEFRASDRSHISSNKRTGVMYYEKNPGGINPYFEVNQNVPAHEFGHILGLGDRYVYTAQVVLIAKAIGNNFVNESISGGTSVFLTETEDPDYSTRYNWLHNLMSRAHIVPESDPGAPAIELEQTFITFHQDYRPSGNTSGNNLDYNTVTVFITPDQFQIIESPFNESKDRIVFFKNDDRPPPNDVFNGSFAGIEGGGMVSDDEYNTYGLATGINPNDIDHKMGKRILVDSDPNSGNSNRRFVFSGRYSPYYGVPKLDQGEPTENSPTYLIDVTQPRRITYYDLEVGGNAFGPSGINHIRRDALRIIDGNNFPLGNPPFLRNAELVEHIKDLNKTQSNDNNRYIGVDAFDNLGEGDTFGMHLWKEKGSNTNDENPDYNNPVGQKPFSERTIDPVGGDSSIFDKYHIIYEYYYNRRAIIEIIGENRM